MTTDERSASGDSPRARALERLLPALVHRLNNAMAVIQGVQELGERAPGRDRDHARAELRTVAQVLARLGALAREPSGHEQLVDLGAVALAHLLLLRPMAESLGIELETRPVAPLAVRADARLEPCLLALGSECLAELREREGVRRRLRLSVRAVQSEARIVLSAPGLARAPASLVALEGIARQRGARCARRLTPGSFCLRLAFPLPREARAQREERPRRSRTVLLLYSPGEERELLATVLREHGCIVRESSGLPAEGTFDLALVERRLAASQPELAGEDLRSRLAIGRVAILDPCPRPQQLLDLVRERS